VWWSSRVMVVAVVASACAGPVSSGPQGTSAPAPAAAETSVPSVSSTYPVPDFGGEVPDEYEFVLECMEWYGFAGEVDPRTGEGLVFDHAPEATDQFVAAITDCSNAWRRVAGMPTELPGRDELAEMYDRFMAVQECLEENGFPVADPPTREVFVEADSAWHPYDALYLSDGIDPETVEAAELACPAE